MKRVYYALRLIFDEDVDDVEALLDGLEEHMRNLGHDYYFSNEKCRGMEQSIVLLIHEPEIEQIERILNEYGILYYYSLW